MSEFFSYFVFGGLIFLSCFILFYFGLRKLKKIFGKEEKEKKVSRFKCLDGDIVKSRGELIIDNHLHRLGINHAYEKTVKVRGEPIKCDWFLPDYKVYIEYWGFHGKAYKKRKEEKIKLYKKGNLALISIENPMFSDIYSNLERELKKHVKKIDLTKAGRYCPNCGFILDKRF